VKTAYDFKAGEILLVDKPLKWTSFDVVNKLRYHLKHGLKMKKIKVGHAGTLDPLATGLLVLCSGKMTKQLQTFQGEEKEYTGTFHLGATTPSYDLETEVNETFETAHINEQLLNDTLQQFLGEIQQAPPLFSAKRINGKRAYELARKGEEVEMKKNAVHILEFELTDIRMPEVDFRILCSKGTYIRSIAYDFGKALNSGAHLIKLCRTGSGEFKLKDAHSVEKWIEIIDIHAVPEG
jgi:tRNA pseudouridine55 synthase